MWVYSYDTDSCLKIDPGRSNRKFINAVGDVLEFGIIICKNWFCIDNKSTLILNRQEVGELIKELQEIHSEMDEATSDPTEEVGPIEIDDDDCLSPLITLVNAGRDNS
jgi:hypothetical protein